MKKMTEMTEMTEMSAGGFEEALEGALFDEFPWLERIEAKGVGLVEELVLTFVDGSQASVPLLSGFPAPEDPEGPFGQAVLRAWWRAKRLKVGR